MGLEHQRYQLTDMRRDAGGEADGRTLFGLSMNVMAFDYGLKFAKSSAIARNLSLGPVEDLSISVYDRADAEPLRIDFDVNPALHSAADLEGYRDRFLRLLTSFTEPDRVVGSLDILDPAERETILRRWNDTARDLGPALVPELFAAQAARTPDAIAVMFEGRALTYAALDAHANRLAHHLRMLGVGPETVVGLCVERSLEMLIGLLAILKAGGAYVPLDAGYPPERLEFMLADAGVSVLVTQSALVDRLPGSATSARVVRLDPLQAFLGDLFRRHFPRPPSSAEFLDGHRLSVLGTRGSVLVARGSSFALTLKSAARSALVAFASVSRIGFNSGRPRRSASAMAFCNQVSIVISTLQSPSPLVDRTS